MLHRNAIVWLVVALLPPAILADESVRVGIVFPGKHDVYDEVLTRLEAGLTDAPVQLTVVPPEKAPAAPGHITSAGEVTAVGKLAEADLLVSFSVGRDAQLLGISTYDVPTVVLLADNSIAGFAPDQIAKLATLHIRRALSKTRTEAKSVRIAKIAPPTSDLYLGSQLSLAAFTQLLQQRLCASSSLALVLGSEAAWNAARGVAAKPKLADFDYQIAIWAERSEARKVKLTVGVKGEDELKQLSFEGELDGQLLEEIATGICVACGVAKLPDRPPAQTAVARYTAITESLWAQNKKRGAIRAAEMASVLNATDVEAQRLLSKRLMREVYDIALAKAADWGEREQRLFVGRAFEIERQLAAQLADDDLEAIRNDVRFPDAVHRLGNMHNLLRLMQERVAPPELAALKDRFQFCLTRPLALYHAAAKSDPKLVEDYSLVLAHRMSHLCGIENADAVAGQAAVDAAQNWLDLFDALPKNRQIWRLTHIVLRDMTLNGMVRDEQVLEPLLKRLDKHPHALARLLGRQGRLTHQRHKREHTPAEKAKQFREIRESALQILDAAKADQEHYVIDGTLQFLDENLNRLTRSSEMAGEMLTTAEELMKREMLRSRILLGACRYVDDDSAERAHALLEELVELCRTNPAAINGGSVQIALTRGEQQLARLENKWPKLRGEPAEDRVAVKPLLDLADLPFVGARILHPKVQGERVYAMALVNDDGGPVAQLVSAPLGEGKTRALGRRPLPRFVDIRQDIVTAACATGESYFAALEGVGLVEFDMRAPRAVVVVEAKSLPEGRIQSLAWAGSQLYAGMERGKLMKIRPMVRTVERLAATDVALVKTPLDNRPPFSIPYILEDPTRRRLLLVTQEPPGSNRSAELWEHDLRSGKFQLLHRLGRPQRGITAHLAGDTLTLADVWIATFNFKTGENTIVANYAVGDLAPTRKIWIDGLHRPAMCGDTAWWMNYNGGLGQLDYPDGKPQTHYLKQLARDKFNAGDRSFAAPIDGRRFLLYHEQQLWLATPKTPPGDDVKE